MYLKLNFVTKHSLNFQSQCADIDYCYSYVIFQCKRLPNKYIYDISFVCVKSPIHYLHTVNVVNYDAIIISNSHLID